MASHPTSGNARAGVTSLARMKRLLCLALLFGCKPSPSITSVDAASAAPSAVAEVDAGTDAGRKLTLADIGASPPGLGVQSDNPSDVIVTGKPGGPKGLASIGAATAKPAIPDVDRVIAGLRPKFRRCYQTALDADPKVAGSADVEAAVAANGEVAAASAKSSSTALEPVAQCVARAVKNAAFSVPEGGGVSKMTFKVTFAIDKEPPFLPH